MRRRSARPGVSIRRNSDNSADVSTLSSKCPDLGYPLRMSENIALMRVYHSRGGLIGKGQKRVARASPLPGDVGVCPRTNKVPPSPGCADANRHERLL